MMKIICFGDSNTYGYDPSDFWEGRFAEYKRWTSILSQLTDAEVINLGLNGREVPYPGADAAICLAQISRHLPADLIIIMLGTNDVLNGSSAEDISHRLYAFIKRLQPLEVIVLTPLIITSYGSIILRESEKLGTLLSQFTDVCVQDTSKWNIRLQSDGIHIAEESQSEFAHCLFSCLHKCSIADRL